MQIFGCAGGFWVGKVLLLNPLSSLIFELSQCYRPLGWAHISKRGASSSPSWTPSRTHSWLLILQKYLIIRKEWLKIGYKAEDATQGRSLRLNDVHWKEESVYLIRAGEREGGREKEGVRDCEGSGERERQKERHSLLSDESETERERRWGGVYKGGRPRAQKWKKDTGIEVDKWKKQPWKENNVHLRFGRKSGNRRRSGHSDRPVSTTCPFVFHHRLRQRAVLHASVRCMNPPISPQSPKPRAPTNFNTQ